MDYTKKYIELLRTINESETPINTDGNDSDLDIQLYSELVQAEYLDGRIQEYISGERKEVISMLPTIKGRIYQNKLEQELKEQTFKGRILKHVPITIAVVLGFFFNAILEILKKYIF